MATRKPLSRVQFELLHAWIKAASRNATQYAEGNKAFIQDTPWVPELFTAMSKVRWPTRPDQYFTMPVTGDVEYARKRNTTVRKWLKIASEANHFRYAAVCSVITTDDQSNPNLYRLAWEKELGDDLTETPEHIVWCRAPYWSEFIDLLVRGARIEAELLGHTFHCIEVDTTRSISDQIEQYLGSCSAGPVDPSECVFIFDLIDQAVLSSITLGRTRISSGYGVGNLVQDNHKIGEILADALWSSLKDSPARQVGILYPDDEKSRRGHEPMAGPVGDRIRAFLARFQEILERHDAKCPIRELYANMNTISHPHEICTTLPSQLADLAKDTDIGVFVPAGESAALLLAAAHGNPILQSRLKVVTADIVPTLVDMLSEDGYPLEAVCGTDPINYGRLHVRIAIGPTPQSRPDPVSPILLTRSSVKSSVLGRHGIRLTSDIFDYEATLRKLQAELQANVWDHRGAAETGTGSPEPSES